MSYRSFKRLLGETSLERKCRLLLGGGIFILILVSFFCYGWQAEKFIKDQSKVTGQLLVNHILSRRHAGVTATELPDGTLQLNQVAPAAVKEIEELLPQDMKYTSRFLRPDTDSPEYDPRGNWEREAFKELIDGRRDSVDQTNDKQHVFRYMGAIRLKESCMKCHPTQSQDVALGKAGLKPNDMIAAVSLELPLTGIETALNVNRAILLSFGIATSIVAMVFAYIIVRYVIVKPVAHLKEVAEEVASGNLTVRSSIQTGDEFQELSHAFNRMLRSLVSMQDELRKVNTDLDQKLDELARANMALFEMNKIKSEFLATISHELRTPLNSILGFSDLLAEIELLPKQLRWIQNIQTSGKNLLTLINDILDLAKLEAGKMQVHVEEFSLRDVVEGQISMTRPLADKKNIALIAEVDPVIPILSQDSSKLQQILSNLLSNAIKFTPEGGQIKVICRADRGHVVISVIDNGVGIAPQDQKLIFEKFRQAESSLTRHHSGTGLGLSIVRELTKLLGGDGVDLESELGRGSTFTVRLPMHLSEQRQMELTLGDEPFGFSKPRENEVRYYSSRDRVLGADI